MRIGLVTSEFVLDSNFDGGLATYTYKLSRWLKDNSHDVTVFLYSGERDVNGFERIYYEGIEVVKIYSRDYSWLIKYYLCIVRLESLYSNKLAHRIKLWQATLAIKRQISYHHARKKYDIIQYSHLGGFSRCRLKDIPVVVRISSSTQLCQFFGGYNLNDIQISEQIRFETKAMAGSNAVFGPSRLIAKLTENQINRKVRVIETPYMSLKEDLDFSIYNSTLINKNYILFFGSISLIKGVGTIAEIIGPLLNRRKDLYFVFVGKILSNRSVNGNTVWENVILNAGENCNRIIHINPLKQSQLFPIIQHAELVTLPSRIDNFPNTCIESMAHGKIVIGTKGNGFDQLVEDGISGFTIDVDDHLDLLEKIEFVLDLSVDAKREIETKAIERIDSLKPDIVLNQLLELYMDTIKNHKK